MWESKRVSGTFPFPQIQRLLYCLSYYLSCCTAFAHRGTWPMGRSRARKENLSFYWISEIVIQAQRKLAPLVPFTFSGHPSCPAGHSTCRKNLSFSPSLFQVPKSDWKPKQSWKYFPRTGMQLHITYAHLPSAFFFFHCWESSIPLTSSQNFKWNNHLTKIFLEICLLGLTVLSLYYANLFFGGDRCV